MKPLDLSIADRTSLVGEVTASALPGRKRTVTTKLVVGSMGGGRQTHAKRALHEVVDRPAPGDTFGLITFDDEVEVVAPAGPVTDRDRIKRVVDGVSPRGSADSGNRTFRPIPWLQVLDLRESWIRQSISREVDNIVRAIRLPVHMCELVRKVLGPSSA